jgi:hypothetical protein
VKLPISKSLVFSFFLIGIIVGMVLLDAELITLPSLDITPERPVANKPAARESVDSAPKASTQTHPKTTTVQQSVAAPVPHVANEPVICDQKKALAVRKSAREVAVIAEQGAVLSVTLNPEWAYYSAGIRRSFIERFVVSDTCLQGRSRVIHFYFRGERIAITDTFGGIDMK